jgi:hypothetical protein
MHRVVIALCGLLLPLLITVADQAKAQPYRCGTLITDRKYEGCDDSRPVVAKKPHVRDARTDRIVKQLRDSYRKNHPRAMAAFKRACDNGHVAACRSYWSLQASPPY